MDKVNLFVIGASKCGTTTLWELLNSHDKICMSSPKEPSFFSFSSFKSNLSNYNTLFDWSRNFKYWGDASPIYSETTLIPDMPKRIFEYNPDAKIIYIVRKPNDRLESVWKQTVSSGHWYQPIYKKHTDVEVGIMPFNFEKALYNYPAFLEATRYWTHLKNYKQYFKDSNILVVFFDDLITDNIETSRKIYDFLDLPFSSTSQNMGHSNLSKGKRAYSPIIMSISRLRLMKFVLKIVRFSGVNISQPKFRISERKMLTVQESVKVNSILQQEIKSILEYARKPVNFWDD